MAGGVAQGITAGTGLPSDAQESRGVTTGNVLADVAGSALSGGLDRTLSQALGDNQVASWASIGENAVGHAAGDALGTTLDPMVTKAYQAAMQSSRQALDEATNTALQKELAATQAKISNQIESKAAALADEQLRQWVAAGLAKLDAAWASKEVNLQAQEFAQGLAGSGNAGNSGTSIPAIPLAPMPANVAYSDMPLAGHGGAGVDYLVAPEGSLQGASPGFDVTTPAFMQNQSAGALNQLKYDAQWMGYAKGMLAFNMASDQASIQSAQAAYNAAATAMKNGEYDPVKVAQLNDALNAMIAANGFQPGAAPAVTEPATQDQPVTLSTIAVTPTAAEVAQANVTISTTVYGGSLAAIPVDASIATTAVVPNGLTVNVPNEPIMLMPIDPGTVANISVNLANNESLNQSVGYALGVDDKAGAFMTGASTALDKLYEYADPEAVEAEAKSAFAGIQYGVPALVRDVGGAAAGVVSVGVMYKEYSEGDYAGAVKSGGAGIGAIFGAEAGLMVSTGLALTLGPEAAVLSPFIVAGFSLYGAYLGGNAASWIYNKGFDGWHKILMQLESPSTHQQNESNR